MQYLNFSESYLISHGSVFFGEVQRCILAMSYNEFKEHTIKDLLPYDYEHKCFKDKVGSEKLDLIREIAAKIADSLTFILSVSNIKAICSSHYFHKHLIVLYIFNEFQLNNLSNH